MSVETPCDSSSNPRLLRFFNEAYLSDCIIKQNDIEINSHKIILAASSDYIYDHFQMNTLKIRKDDKDIIEIPEMVQTLFSKGNHKDCLLIIIKYCYSNQNFEIIQREVTDENLFTILSFAHCMRMKSLIEHLERRIVDGMLKEENKIKMLNEAQIFELPQLKEVAMQMIKKDFQNIKSSIDGITQVVEFNFETFKTMVSSDELQLENEKDVCDLILGYIQNRRDIKPIIVDEVSQENENEKKEIVEEINKVKEEELKEEILKEEEEPKEEEEAPKEEEEAPKEEEEAPKEEEEAPKEEEEAPKEEEKAPIEEEPKEKVNLLQNWKDHILSIQKTIEKTQLTKEQERELIECIRFSFLSHNDLIALSLNEILSDHKDLLLEGLSVRLNTYETTTSKVFKINLTPRQNSLIIPPGTSTEILHQQQEEQHQHQQQHHQQQQQYDQLYSSKSHPQLYSTQMSQQIQQGSNILLSSTMPNNQGNFNPSMSQRMFNNNNFDQMNTMYQTIQPKNTFIKATNNQRYPEEETEEQQQMKLKKEQEKLYKSNPNPRPPQESIVSMDYLKHMSLIAKPTIVFKYEYDFDENGVFYYLGSLGKMAPYKNPHEIAQVKVFSSSIGKGSLGDFVGRQSVNLRTLNEDKSFFGVDLGQERFLIPSSYSIKNRESSSHVLLCWCLEASNDKVNFEVLDTRIFSNSNQKYHQSLEKERNMLKKPGSTSTWGISKKFREKFTKGFRYFILKQVDQNSSGGFNLAISGFELYGEALGRNWFFN